jgi:hypothetical protein
MPLQAYSQDSSQPHNNSTAPVIHPIIPQTLTNMPNTNPKYQWQQVAYSKKRRRNTEEFGSTKKQDYWLGDPITVNNRYSTLSDEETMEGEAPNVEPKPPPIFISGVKKYKTSS